MQTDHSIDMPLIPKSNHNRGQRSEILGSELVAKILTEADLGCFNSEMLWPDIQLQVHFLLCYQ